MSKYARNNEKKKIKIDATRRFRQKDGISKVISLHIGVEDKPNVTDTTENKLLCW